MRPSTSPSPTASTWPPATCRRPSGAGITTVRDAGGADLGHQGGRRRRAHRRASPADLPAHAQPDRRPRRRLVRLGRRRAALADASRHARTARRRPRRDAAQGPRARSGPAPTSSRSPPVRRRRFTARRPPPCPLPAGRARRPRRGGDGGRDRSSWPTPRLPTGSRTPSGPASGPSSTASSSTTRRIELMLEHGHVARADARRPARASSTPPQAGAPIPADVVEKAHAVVDDPPRRRSAGPSPPAFGSAMGTDTRGHPARPEPRASSCSWPS